MCHRHFLCLVLVVAERRMHKLTVPRQCCPAPPAPSWREASPRVLIGVVTSGLSTHEVLMASMTRLAAEPVSWAVALYKGSRIHTVIDHAHKLGVSMVAYDAKPLGLQCPFCPKLQFQLTFVAHLGDAEYIWLVDDDISFEQFEWLGFWAKHQAALNPIIAQPLIRQNTQSRNFFVNLNQWHNCSNSAHVHSTYVEQQAPVLDAGFFRWLAPQVASIAKFQQDQGNDWGLDLVWCGAAFLFDETRPPCTIVLDAIDHLDTRTIPKTESYIKSGRLMKAIANRTEDLAVDHDVIRVMDFFANSTRRIPTDQPQDLRVVEGCRERLRRLKIS